MQHHIIKFFIFGTFLITIVVRLINVDIVILTSKLTLSFERLPLLDKKVCNFFEEPPTVAFLLFQFWICQLSC
jgi:hypothetical protein